MSGQRERGGPELGFATRSIHAGYDARAHGGALNVPVVLSSTFGFASVAEGQRRFAGEESGLIYSRVTNPTVQVLEARIAALENGAAAVACASGMGAIASLLWTIVGPGAEIIVDRTLYGCTHALVHDHLPELGVRTLALDLTDPGALGDHLSDRTTAVLFETPANPNMRVIDIAAVAEAVRKRSGALVIADNTYCTPYLQRPLELGADVVVHSATKYLNGHGDVMAGVVVGGSELMERVRFTGVQKLTGACLSAMDAFLVLRGLKTLSLRMEQHCRTASALAEQLAGHPAVARVHYPGLPTHPQHALAGRQMRLPGAMIALELKGGYEAGVRFMDALELFTRAVSLGDAESLAQHPASMTHSTVRAEARAAHGIAPGLVRLSIGLEDPGDLAADLMAALAAA
jgi:methionine gamma-lyase